MTRNLLAIRHLDKPDIEDLLALSKDCRKSVVSGSSERLAPKKVVGLLFFEGSTRTRVSFEQAANYLGYRVTNFSSAGSSMSKGETLKDTILTLRYERLEALVMRHRSSGSPSLAARYFGGPVINAGDGQHEHPTQALGDALTILDRKGTLKGLRVSIVGDVEHSRVARSNAWLLHKMGSEVRFVGPRTLMPNQMAMLPGTAHYDLITGIEDADVIICLRLQKERMDDGMLSSVGEYRRLYQINRETLRFAANDCLIMHPGPLNRGIEIDDNAVDSDNSAIHDQVQNGIFVRMAALHWVFLSPPAAKASESSKGASVKAKSIAPKKAAKRPSAKPKAVKR